jgi:hypothetical protein
VLCFQAKGGAISIESFFKGIHQRLLLASPAYRAQCDPDSGNALDTVYLPPGPQLTGAVRVDAMTNNLLRVMDTERVLIVLDGLEANLLGHEAADPAWDGLLASLAARLPGTGSRFLLTSRRLPRALGATGVVSILLGLFSPADAVAFAEGSPVFRALRQSNGAIADRVEAAGRGHPFVLAGLAELVQRDVKQDGALSPQGRVVLRKALDPLEADGYEALFRVLPDARSAAVAEGLVDLLIAALPFEARRLLWTLVQGREPSQPPGPLLDALREAWLVRPHGEGAPTVGRLVADRIGRWMDAHPHEKTA